MSNGDADESLNTSFSSVTFVSTANVGFKELYLKKKLIVQIKHPHQTTAKNEEK